MEAPMLILPIAYFPPISYFSKIAANNSVYVEGFENFIKQTPRSRCEILGANNIQVLTVPVLKEPTAKTLTKDARISYTENWHKNHWKSIESAYRSSPFFEYFVDDIYPFFEKKYKYLFDYNFEILEMLKQNLGLDTEIIPTTHFTPNNKELDIGKRNGAKTKKQYVQVFSDRKNFVDDLSVLDLLFNTGSEAIDFL